MTVESPELTKYNKRIEDLIENTQIEAELEAENRIRSKNARLILISATGLMFLIMVYFSINSKPKPTPLSKKSTLGKSEEYIPFPKPIPFPLDSKAISQQRQKPTSVPPSSSQSRNTKIVKPKLVISKAVKKSSKESNPVSILTKKTTPKLPIKLDYFIQMGAFSIKKNAVAFSKTLKAKGLSPKIYPFPGHAEIFSVFVGKFKDKKFGQSLKRDLEKSGFYPKIQDYEKDHFSFILGEFKTSKEAHNLRDKLSKNGFLPGLNHNKEKASTFIVGVGQYGTLKETKAAQTKIRKLGYLNSFPKKIG